MMVSLKHGMHGNELDPGSRTYCKTWPILAPSILAFISPYVSLSLDLSLSIYPFNYLSFTALAWARPGQKDRRPTSFWWEKLARDISILLNHRFFFWGTYVSLKKWELSLETNGRFPYAQGHQDDLRLGPALHRVSPSCLQYLHGGGGPMFQEGAMGDDGWRGMDFWIISDIKWVPWRKSIGRLSMIFFSLMLVDV